MSTELHVIETVSGKKLHVTQFFGGSDRGTCLQLTMPCGYIQLARDDVKALLPLLKEWATPPRRVQLGFALSLSMPSGRWSGEGNLYAIVVSVSPAKASEVLAKSYYSSGWNDGWRVAVQVKKVTGSEVRLIRKHSRGFCGYEWMVDSILARGFITTEQDEKEKKATAIKTQEPANSTP